MNLKGILFFLMLIVTTAGVSLSQEVSNSPYGRVEKVGTTVWEWFNYAKTISEVSDLERSRRSFIFPDTTVYVGYNTGIDKVSSHGVGQVLDPCAPLFSQTNAVLDSTKEYTVEKISIAYRYFRPIDTLSDVLWIQFYNDEVLDRVVDPQWPSGASYATADYDWKFRKGSNPTVERTYFLSNADTSNFGGIRNLEIPVEINVPAGGKFALSLSFDHFNKTYTGDTLDPYLYPKKKVNAFMAYEVQDVESNVEIGHYNHSLIANTPIRYDSDLEGWNGRYRPGTSWASTIGIFHLDVSFLLRYEEPVGLAESSALETVSIGPNPVSNTLSLHGFTPAQYFHIDVYDVHGHLVKAQKGIKPEVDVTDFTPGIYFLKLIHGGHQIQKRFTKL